MGGRQECGAVSGGFGARNRPETPGDSGATVGCLPASGRDGLRRREKSGYGGNLQRLRRRFRRGKDMRAG